MEMLTVRQPGWGTAMPLPRCVAAVSPRRRSFYWHIAWLFGLTLCSGFSGCGPAVSDSELNRETRASLTASPALPSVPQQSRPSPAGQGPPPPADDFPPQPDTLVLPVWMAQALDAPDVRVRLQALDKWAKLGTQASLDPLVVALDDENDDVRNKAMEIIEQRWMEEQETESEAVRNGETSAARP
ncbi:MAG: hypothetical protein RL768_1015 [Nitrospirota bacterium]